MYIGSGYQRGPRIQGTRLNAALLVSYLFDGVETVLDIGSNEGIISCAIAISGPNVTGYEVNSRFVRRARKLAGRLGCRAAFENRSLLLDDLLLGPEYDATVFLSVHHQIAAMHGLEHANDFLRTLARKTRYQLFFQPAVIQEKYGKNAPDLQDNDLAGYLSYFSDVIGDEMPFVATIGLAQNDLPKSEPFRPMVVFSKKPIRMRASSAACEIDLKVISAVRAGSIL